MMVGILKLFQFSLRHWQEPTFQLQPKVYNIILALLMSRIERRDLTDELALMEYSEQEIMELQSILRLKLGENFAVIKKAMDIEDYLYKEALYKNGHERSGNLWESHNAIKDYRESLSTLKILMHAKEGDWTKLYALTDMRQFCTQMASNRQVSKKKVGVFCRKIERFLIFSEDRRT